MFWKWKCKACSREFTKEAGFVIQLICRYCRKEDGFDLIKEQKTKYE